MQCNVCNTPLGEPIYESSSEHTLTSLCELREGRSRVWGCRRCGHLRGEALPDTPEYYETEYRILLDHDDEDQIYDTRDDQIIYRTDHQLDTLLSKLELPAGTQLLDYGCAKAAMPKRLLAVRPELQIHLFDVSDMYRAYWDRLIPPERQATHQTPPDWQARFDVVTSYFALEHIPEPRATVAHVRSLLKDDGVFYGIVPDTFGNPGDFFVLDHVNHFTSASLHALLREAGFQRIEIDAAVHRGALVFSASPHGTATPCPDPQAEFERGVALARHWHDINERLQRAEANARSGPAAIYGSGFYGAYITSSLQDPSRIQCYLDRNPFLQGRQLFGKPVLTPQSLPEDVRTLYIGLNPSVARTAMAEMSWLKERDIDLVFLDEAQA